jgi:hypothetical protein
VERSGYLELRCHIPAADVALTEITPTTPRAAAAEKRQKQALRQTFDALDGRNEKSVLANVDLTHQALIRE